MAESGLPIGRKDTQRRAALPAISWRQISASVLWLTFLINAAVIVALWLNGGGVSAVTDWPTLSTSIGRITGLLSAYLALVQVLLLARLPWLERLLGFDRLTVWHRRNGKLTLYLVLAHVVFITIGYAGMDRLSIPSEVETLLTQYPGMVAATFGTGLMILVVLTSIVIVRRHMNYELWYLVHFTAYLAIALAWIHQVPTGNELAVDAAAATYWNSLYIATIVLLVGFRVVQPAIHAFWYGLRVEEVAIEGPGVVSLRVGGRHIGRLRVKPGQFFLWRFLDRHGWWQAHPFSVSEAPNGRSLRITVKDLGNYTERMRAIKVGTRVIAEGPFGTFTASRARSDRIVLVAGGIGITPIRALLETLHGNLVLLYRVLHAADIIFRDEIDSLARERGIAVHYVIGDHRNPGGERLMSPDHLRELVPDIDGRDVFVCGPPGMASFLEKNVRRAGVPKKQIHMERFAL